MSTPRQRSSSSSFSTKRNGRAAVSPAVPPQTPAPLPAADDRDGWRAHWQAQGQPWRTEPEIDQKRQVELAKCRSVAPNIEQGIYPFKDMKLGRADIEWLLATHENGRGLVDWSDENQRKRGGIDVRGADLRQVNLQRLPLACLRGGLTWPEWLIAIPEQRAAAGVHLEGADLRWAHLEGAIFIRGHLETAALREAHLEQADFGSAYLERAIFQNAHLEQANFRGAHLDRVSFVEAHLAGTDFHRARLEGTNFFRAHLEGSQKLEHNTSVDLPPADLRAAFFDAVSNLGEATLGEKQSGFISVADVHWRDVNLAVVDWATINMLGDEFRARQQKEHDGTVKEKEVRLQEYEQATRANRQISVALQSQGLNRDGARFAYRAQILERRALWFQMLQRRAKLKLRWRSLGDWLFSWFLFLLAGYGYRPGRSFLTYFLVIFGFATVYYFIGHTVGPTLSLLGAFVFSMTSFHGRGFFPGNNISLDDPLTVFAAFEALVGLIIEVTFIATLTQRFFSR